MRAAQITIAILGLAVLASLALTSCQAKEAASGSAAAPANSAQSSSLASKLLPQTKTRTARSLSDMFEKVKSKIFGNKKQSTASTNSAASQQVQPAASVVSAQRQPWADVSVRCQVERGARFDC